MLVRKMDLIRIPLHPHPTVEHNDLYGFACLPPMAWIAVLYGPDGTLVCHDAYNMAISWLHVPDVVRPLKDTVAPRHGEWHADLSALEGFFSADDMEELNNIFKYG